MGSEAAIHDEPRLRARWTRHALELAVLFVAAAWVMRHILDFDPNVNPAGREYFGLIYSHFQWDVFKSCGTCAFWNGQVRGGFPALVDVQASALHPIVAVPSLIWGPLNGTKVALVLAVFFSGVALWWLALELGYGAMARLFMGGMAIGAGWLTGKMQNGVVGLVIAGMACSLLLPAILRVVRDPTYRNAAVLGLLGSMVLVAGQQYVQLGMFAVLPAFLLLIGCGTHAWQTMGRRYALAAGIAVLIASPFLVPLTRFYPQFTKGMDPTFASGQPLIYMPLNFVIKDNAYYTSEVLGKTPYPYLHSAYMGWIPVLLAAIGFASFWKRGRQRVALAFALPAVMLLWVGSAAPIGWLAERTTAIDPAHDFLIGLRNPSLMATMATPFVLALAGAGVDAVMRELRVPSILLTGTHGRQFTIDPVSRALFGFVLFVSVLNASTYNGQWLTVTKPPADEAAAVGAALQTPGAAWVSTPFGEQYWWGAALAGGLKLTDKIIVWSWKGRVEPIPEVEASRLPALEGRTMANEVSPGIWIHLATENDAYARVEHEDGSVTRCSATSQGGWIDVRCDLDQPGVLRVMENVHPDWDATVNGERAVVEDIGTRIAVEVPEGASTISLRFRPWDVWVGLACMVAGLVVAGWCIAGADRFGWSLVRKPQPHAPPAPSA